jgi:pyrroloquinoline quinone (PQQ) biosynthesis protein C
MKSKHQERILSFYNLFPFHKHPFWTGVINGTFSYKQILQAEKQHYLRTKEGQALRRNSVQFAPSKSPKIFEAALGNYLEEVAPTDSQPSHLDLIERLLLIGGIAGNELKRAKPTAGNAAAMALYKDIARRGTACHLIGAGAVEYYYSELSPKIFDAYISHYGMTPEQAETYSIHGPVDRVHAERALDVLDEAISLHGTTVIEESVRDAFVATSLHYDGMHQAALGRIVYWDGEEK